MDDTTKGGSDKRGWRERLGIGTKDMPKISDEFRPPESLPAAEKQAVRPTELGTAPRGPLPISKPAPMAPRAPVRPAGPAISVTTSAKPAASSPSASSAPAPARPAVVPPSQPGLAPDALANRLKAQREAAEKLAEQRIQVARQRAEAAARNDQPRNDQPRNDHPRMPGFETINVPGGAAQGTGGAKPKFTFAEDDARNQSNGAPGAAQSAPQLQMPKPMNRPPGMPPAAPLAPPRQPLGAAPRSAQPQSYPQGDQGGYQAGYVPSPGYSAPQPQQYAPPYRPIDPVTGYAGPVPGGKSSYAPPSPPRGQSPQGYAEEGDYGYSPVPQRPMARPMAPTQRQATPPNYGDPEDIFEQPVRGQRRPTAGEYRQAYQEPDVGFEEEQQRSIAPWFWVLMVLAALAAAGLGIWIWRTAQTTQAVKTPTQVEQPVQETSKAPVVEPPSTATKTEPEPIPQPTQTNANTTNGQVTPPASPTKKQIYDRIVGDREVQGNAALAPTEIEPVAPDPAQPNTAPALQDQGAEDAVPLPVPPPANNDGTQGALEPPPPLPGEQQEQIATTTIGSTTTNQSASANTQVTALSENASTTASQPPPQIRPASTSEDNNLATGSSATTTKSQPESSNQQQAVADEIEDLLPMPKDKVVETGNLNPAPAPIVPAPTAVTEPVEVAKTNSQTSVQPSIPSEAQQQFANAAAKASADADEAALTVSPAETDEAVSSDSNPTAETPEVKPKQDTAATTTVADTKPEAKPPAPKPKKVASNAKQTNKATKKRATSQKQLGAEPVVLVPPAGQSATSTSSASADGIYGELPQATDKKPETGKKRTLLELFNQKNGETAEPELQQEQQVAAVQPKRLAAAPQQEAAQPARQAAAPQNAGGYVAQLASFASRDEASQEFQRMKTRHPEILRGAAPVISEATVGGSRRYRLAVGPMQSNAAAGQVCSRLLSAGERDCLVRRQ